MIAQPKYNPYTVENVQETQAEWGQIFVADIRVENDPTLYVIGPAYSVKQLVQMTLERFGKTR